MASISLNNVVKRYGSGAKANPVIHGVSAEIADHEFIVIVGPSGCGKSTLLRMVAGLEEVTAGTISIGGRVVNDVEPSERDIAMVFQNYALYPHMSVFDNMAYGLKIAKIPLAEIKLRVDKAAKILELGPYLQRKPRELSGGQRQRVAMGRAIVRQPQVFLFDEPLSNLDAMLRVQMRMELSNLHHDLAATMIYVTHDQIEAMTMADRIVVLDQGRIRQVGSPMDLYNHPADRFVAAFIGSPSMNFLPATLTGNGERLGLALHGGKSLSLVPRQLSDATGAVELGVRPEHATLTAPDAPDTAIQGMIKIVERLGNQTLVHLEAPGGLFTLQGPGDIAAKVGEAAGVTFDTSRAHVFGPDGRAL